MVSSGPPPPLLLQRPQQQQQQQQHVLLQHPVLLQYTLLQHPLSSKDNASTSSDVLAAAYLATAAAVLIPGSTWTQHEGERRCNFRSEDIPLSGPTSRSCTSGSVRGTNQDKNVMLPASPRRQGVSSVHPQRYQGFNPTFSQGIILYYTRGDLPEMHRANVAVFDG